MKFKRGYRPRRNRCRVRTSRVREEEEGDEMMVTIRHRSFRRTALQMTVCILFLGALLGAAPRSAHSFFKSTALADDSSMLDGFRRVELASVSDAIEKISGQRTYMSHHMRPLFPSKFAGFALTVQLKKEENKDPNALDGMLAAIEQGAPNSV